MAVKKKIFTTNGVGDTDFNSLRMLESYKNSNMYKKLLEITTLHEIYLGIVEIHQFVRVEPSFDIENNFFPDNSTPTKFTVLTNVLLEGEEFNVKIHFTEGLAYEKSLILLSGYLYSALRYHSRHNVTNQSSKWLLTPDLGTYDRISLEVGWSGFGESFRPEILLLEIINSFYEDFEISESDGKFLEFQVRPDTFWLIT
jgi:hypothetical protein